MTTRSGQHQLQHSMNLDASTVPQMGVMELPSFSSRQPFVWTMERVVVTIANGPMADTIAQ